MAGKRGRRPCFKHARGTKAKMSAAKVLAREHTRSLEQAVEDAHAELEAEKIREFTQQASLVHNLESVFNLALEMCGGMGPPLVIEAFTERVQSTRRRTLDLLRAMRRT